LRREHPSLVKDLELVRQFPSWVKCLYSKSSPIESEIPWLTFGAIRVLKKLLDSRSVVFEYGCGGSTFFFADRAQKVVCVEHDPAWADLVLKRLSEKGIRNVDLVVKEPGEEHSLTVADPSDPDSYASSDEHFTGRSFREYVQVIDQYPDESFDIILIDGRARPSCFKHARKKLRPGGAIIWDNMERDYYWKSMGQLSSAYKMTDCPGPCPFLRHFTRTTIWQDVSRR
jgi:predicted O-methyltransferase YrrM